MKRDAADLRSSLLRLVATQAGYFTAAQALGIGYSYPAQMYHHRRGEWARVDRGIYRLAVWPETDHADLVRWTLWSRWHGIVAHETALAVHELGDVLPAKVHMLVPRTFRSADPSVVLHRGDIRADDIQERAGFRVTSPTRAILESAADMDVDRLAGAIRDAVERGVTTASRLRARAGAFGPSAESATESALRQLRR